MAASSPVPYSSSTLLQDDGAEKESWDLLVVYDGVVGGAPKRFKVKKPKAH